MSGRSGRSVLTGGFIALDAICEEDRLHHCAGGTAANVAANLAYLGWRAAVTGVVGRDAAGRRLRSDLRRAGVDTVFVRSRSVTRTPVVVHEVLPSGHRFRFRCPACSRTLPRHRPLAVEDARRVVARAAPANVFVFDRASAACLLIAEKVRARGALIVFEPSSRGRPAAVERALELAHVLRYSSERASHLPVAVRRARVGQLQVRSVGKRGVDFRVGRGGWTRMGGIRTPLVDAAGAGDWLTAGLLAYLPSLAPGRLSAASVEEALARAQALAALSCAYAGARGLAAIPPAATSSLVDVIAETRSVASPPDRASMRPRPVSADLCNTCLEQASTRSDLAG
jgi:fructokinase